PGPCQESESSRAGLRVCGARREAGRISPWLLRWRGMGRRSPGVRLLGLALLARGDPATPVVAGTGQPDLQGEDTSARFRPWTVFCSYHHGRSGLRSRCRLLFASEGVAAGRQVVASVRTYRDTD